MTAEMLEEGYSVLFSAKQANALWSIADTYLEFQGEPGYDLPEYIEQATMLREQLQQGNVVQLTPKMRAFIENRIETELYNLGSGYYDPTVIHSIAKKIGLLRR